MQDQLARVQEHPPGADDDSVSSEDSGELLTTVEAAAKAKEEAELREAQEKLEKEEHDRHKREQLLKERQHLANERLRLVQEGKQMLAKQTAEHEHALIEQNLSEVEIAMEEELVKIIDTFERGGESPLDFFQSLVDLYGNWEGAVHELEKDGGIYTRLHYTQARGLKEKMMQMQAIHLEKEEGNSPKAKKRHSRQSDVKKKKSVNGMDTKCRSHRGDKKKKESAAQHHRHQHSKSSEDSYKSDGEGDGEKSYEARGKSGKHRNKHDKEDAPGSPPNHHDHHDHNDPNAKRREGVKSLEEAQVQAAARKAKRSKAQDLKRRSADSHGNAGEKENEGAKPQGGGHRQSGVHQDELAPIGGTTCTRKKSTSEPRVVKNGRVSLTAAEKAKKKRQSSAAALQEKARAAAQAAAGA
ncbi:unnamed protein product [Chrysoparadoxa australica]